MIANAYFLRPKAMQSNGEGVWMDRYMRLLQWVLDRFAGRIQFGRHLSPPKAAWWQYPGSLSSVSHRLFLTVFARCPRGKIGFMKQRPACRI